MLIGWEASDTFLFYVTFTLITLLQQINNKKSTVIDNKTCFLALSSQHYESTADKTQSNCVGLEREEKVIPGIMRNYSIRR